MEFLIIGVVVALFVWSMYHFVFQPKSKEDVDKDTAAPNPAPTPKPVEAKDVDAGLSQLGLPSYEELMKLTKKQLDAQAAKQGIKLDARQTKKKMVSAYQDGLKSKQGQFLQTRYKALGLIPGLLIG